MKIGPDQIIACPHCGGQAQHITLLSGNNFGAQVWTDGKQIAPMLPYPPAVVKCAHCARCYWLADAEQVATAYLRIKGEPNVNPAWRAAPTAEEPSETEYYAALDSGLAEDDVQERNLRMLAWWRRNDAFRFQSPTAIQSVLDESLSEAGKRSMERLVELLDDEDDSDRLMKAELLRELGQSDEAATILDSVTSKEAAPVAQKLRALCDNHDVQVRQIT